MDDEPNQCDDWKRRSREKTQRRVSVLGGGAKNNPQSAWAIKCVTPGCRSLPLTGRRTSALPRWRWTLQWEGRRACGGRKTAFIEDANINTEPVCRQTCPSGALVCVLYRRNRAGWCRLDRIHVPLETCWVTFWSSTLWSGFIKQARDPAVILNLTVKVGSGLTLAWFVFGNLTFFIQLEVTPNLFTYPIHIWGTEPCL